MKRKNFLRSLLGAAVAPFSIRCNRPPARSAATSVTRSDQLVNRLVEHTNAVYFVGAAYIGDRLGLFKAMAGTGRQTGKQLARMTGFNERYVLEWLRTMAAAGYLEYHPDSTTFELPPAYSEVLVDEGSSLFSAGLIALAVPDIIMLPRVLTAFRSGSGMPYGEYPPDGVYACAFQKVKFLARRRALSQALAGLAPRRGDPRPARGAYAVLPRWLNRNCPVTPDFALQARDRHWRYRI